LTAASRPDIIPRVEEPSGEQRSRLTAGASGVVATPAGDPSMAVLVLAGSSGRIDERRARLLAGRGALAVSIRWFGGPGQPPGICEVPLETFTAVIDGLEALGSGRIGIVGTSKGAEAALWVACVDPRVAAVVAVAPTSVGWANVGPGRDNRTRPWRSSWTWRGRPLPFVPYDDTWPESSPPVAYRTLYEQSLATYPAAAGAAAIPVERTRADLVLIGGGDDQMWPSDRFIAQIEDRRRRSGRAVVSLVEPGAGHRPVFPGEEPPAPSDLAIYGGSPGADRALGRRAWPLILETLGADPPSGP